MRDRGSPWWKYIAETTRLAQVQTIGKPHAFNDVRSGGVKKMEVRQEHTRNGDDPTVPIREASIEELKDAVSRSLPVLYRRAYRYVGDPHDAEDAVQDALLSAFRHLDQFKGTAKMTTWLTSIVTNSALTQLRKRPRQPHMSVEERIGDRQDHCIADTLTDHRPNPEGVCIKSDLRTHLTQLVTELSPALRRVIQLRDLDGLSTSEAARYLGLSNATVKAQVSRARSKLKRLGSLVKKERTQS
jgi:RNA polymerase sigma-70 factor (ECF subfamily)